jgi:hypothetical protein
MRMTALCHLNPYAGALAARLLTLLLPLLLLPLQGHSCCCCLPWAQRPQCCSCCRKSAQVLRSCWQGFGRRPCPPCRAVASPHCWLL